jgi:hypothetical protein
MSRVHRVGGGDNCSSGHRQDSEGDPVGNEEARGGN